MNQKYLLATYSVPDPRDIARKTKAIKTSLPSVSLCSCDDDGGSGGNSNNDILSVMMIYDYGIAVDDGGGEVIGIDDDGHKDVVSDGCEGYDGGDDVLSVMMMMMMVVVLFMMVKMIVTMTMTSHHKYNR